MTNCFDLRCPKCGKTDQIDVSASIWTRVTEDGTDPDLSKDGNHEWGDDSPARCAACCHSGKVTGFRQDEYMAHFRTTAGPAEDIFVADTPEQALELARKAFRENPSKFGFSPADCGYLELQEIRIVDDDAEEVLCWMTDEYRLQLYAPDLLKALESQVGATRAIVDAWDEMDSLPGVVEDIIEALEWHSESARGILDSCESENGQLAAAVSDLQDSLRVALKAIAARKAVRHDPPTQKRSRHRQHRGNRDVRKSFGARRSACGSSEPFGRSCGSVKTRQAESGHRYCACD